MTTTRPYRPIRIRYGLMAVLQLTAIALLAQSAPPDSDRSPASTERDDSSTSWLSTDRWKKVFEQQREMPLANSPAGLQRLATDIVLDNLPEKYDDRRKWGMTREVFDGLHVRLDGLRVRTKRKRKAVNHGTWKRYEISQIEPEKNLRFNISPARTMPDGRAAFQVELSSKVNGVARLSEWNRGVRLMSISLDADLDVTIVVDCRLAVQFDPSRLPPDIILQPEVVDADIKVSTLHVNRVSHLDGKLAGELSSGLRNVITKKIDEKRPKLVSKINRQIKKHEDDLRLSMSDAVSEKWKAFIGSKPSDRGSTGAPKSGNEPPAVEIR